MLQSQRRNFSTFFGGGGGGTRGLPTKNLSVTCFFFFSNSSGSNGPGSGKLPCKNTLYCRFYPVKWKIFKAGGSSAPILLIVSFLYRMIKGFSFHSLKNTFSTSLFIALKRYGRKAILTLK